MDDLHKAEIQILIVTTLRLKATDVVGGGEVVACGVALVSLASNTSTVAPRYVSADCPFSRYGYTTVECRATPAQEKSGSVQTKKEQ